jgi:ABC-2 type transport system permease protein
MTTYPALALLGRLRPSTALAALGGAVLFAGFSRYVWTRSIGHYTSAA